MDREFLKAGPKQPGFYEREAGGTCCSETDGKLAAFDLSFASK